MSERTIVGVACLLLLASAPGSGAPALRLRGGMPIHSLSDLKRDDEAKGGVPAGAIPLSRCWLHLNLATHQLFFASMRVSWENFALTQNRKRAVGRHAGKRGANLLRRPRFPRLAATLTKSR